MCGILGKVCFDGAPVSAEWLGRACALLAHRGPDGAAQWVNGGGAGARVGLGHRRLKVIDLQATADQPMHNRACHQAGRAPALTIVFNGEIYNYRELRADLLARGHRLLTDSDTEVILHLFEEQGPECVTSLRGMFAFAIWDASAQQLFLARDRVGKKPLYYRSDAGMFWFASEPRAILADDAVPVAVRADAVSAYLALGYVPGARSAFEGLHRVPPAHRVLVTSRGVRIDRYWRLDYEPKTLISERDAVKGIREHLTAAVRCRLISDVPLGAFLSGGIDSSAVVATMAREAGSRIRTFSIGFDDSRFNELAYARMVAQRYGTEHHEFVVRPDLDQVLPRLAWHYGEPYADSSAVPTYHLSRLAREHITVALNGDGGDESFAGYRRYRAHAMASRAAAIAPVRGLAASMVRLLPSAGEARSRLYDLRRFLIGLTMTGHERYASWFGFFVRPEADVLTPEFRTKALVRAPLEELERAFAAHADLAPAEAALATDVGLYLPDDLLVKVDIATMAFGLEGRSPLLDHQLMEFAGRLPVALKLQGRDTKPLLRKAFRGMVPDAILDRRKMGFGVPLDAWLRQELRPMAEELVLGPRALHRGYFSHTELASLMRSHMVGERSHAHRIWALMMFELWHRECVDAAATLRIPRHGPADIVAAAH